MIDPQTWPPLSGAVAGCGALLVLSGAAKLVRTARGTGGGTAVQRTLRLGDVPWRVFLAAAGTAELAVGLLVCGGLLPTLADGLMACQGAVFVALLIYAIRKGIPGDCGCVARRRTNSPAGNATTRWSVARAVFVGLAGGVGAVGGVHPPAHLPHSDQAIAWAVALVTSVLLAAVDLELRTPRCRRSLLFPTRTRLAEVAAHSLYQAMAGRLGVAGDQVLFRRTGCVDEFWFPVQRTGQKDGLYLAIHASHTGSDALALRAAVADHVPLGTVRTLPIRSRRPSVRSPSTGGKD